MGPDPAAEGAWVEVRPRPAARAPPRARRSPAACALLAHARPSERAGVLSAIYLISYGGAAVPGLIAGQLSRTLSLFEIALGYGALAGVACVVTLLATGGSRLDQRWTHAARSASS